MSSPSDSPANILIVEDEPAIADNIRYALETEGFNTTWVSIGQDGLAQFQQENITLIILDVGLPDMSGFDFCKQVRKSSQVPIIFLTARSDEIDRVVGLELGADDYVPKPFSPRELSARVKAVLRRTAQSKPGGEAPAQDTPFLLDAEKKQLHYFDEPVTLSRYEFKLMEVLLRHPGRVYSRDELMERVWQEPGSSMDRTVDTHIKTLRAKLRKINPNIDPIVTHRGLGYALNESW